MVLNSFFHAPEVISVMDFKTQSTFRSFQARYSPQYRAWGDVRRKNFLGRLKHVVLMTLLGLASLAAMALMALFAASVAVIGALIGAVGFLMISVWAFFNPKAVKVTIKTDDGVIEARKVGNRWMPYS